MKALQTVLMFSVLLGSSLASERFFSVRIKGKFQCREDPYANLPLDIYQESSSMRYPDFMARFTNVNGEFDLSAYVKTDQYMITPYMVIRHTCSPNKDVTLRCNRKLVWKIPVSSVTSAQEPDKNQTLDVGTVDLAVKHPSEMAVNCGK